MAQFVRETAALEAGRSTRAATVQNSHPVHPCTARAKAITKGAAVKAVRMPTTQRYTGSARRRSRRSTRRRSVDR
jgi:hypothetical protein